MFKKLSLSVLVSFHLYFRSWEIEEFEVELFGDREGKQVMASCLDWNTYTTRGWGGFLIIKKFKVLVAVLDGKNSFILPE